jgi:hypothetical protein
MARPKKATRLYTEAEVQKRVRDALAKSPKVKPPLPADMEEALLEDLRAATAPVDVEVELYDGLVKATVKMITSRHGDYYYQDDKGPQYTFDKKATSREKSLVKDLLHLMENYGEDDPITSACDNHPTVRANQKLMVALNNKIQNLSKKYLVDYQELRGRVYVGGEDDDD